MMSNWVLEHKTDISGRPPGALEASFPQYKEGSAEVWEIDSYVVLAAGRREAILKTSIRFSARGREVFVAPSILPELSDGTQVTCRTLSARKFRFHLLLHDPKQRAALWGGIITLMGILIDGSLAVGKVKELIIISDDLILVSMMFSLLLKALGLWLVIWRGLLDDK